MFDQSACTEDATRGGAQSMQRALLPGLATSSGLAVEARLILNEQPFRLRLVFPLREGTARKVCFLALDGQHAVINTRERRASSFLAVSCHIHADVG